MPTVFTNQGRARMAAEEYMRISGNRVVRLKEYGQRGHRREKQKPTMMLYVMVSIFNFTLRKMETQWRVLCGRVSQFVLGSNGISMATTFRIQSTGTPRFIGPHFTALHRCCIINFYKLKARLSTSKMITVCFIAILALSQRFHIINDVD